MKRFKLIIAGLIVALNLVWVFAIPSYATVSSVTNFYGVSSNTSVSLTWTVATGSVTTMVRSKTTAYPTSPTGADGSTLVFSGVGNSFINTGLIAGTTYYYSAWGYDGANYSATAANFLITTLAMGGLSNGDAFPTPYFPAATAVISPTASPTVLQNFGGLYVIVDNFVADWGMPASNGWMGIILMGITFISIVVYGKTREVFAGFATAQFLMLFSCWFGIVPWWFIGVPLIIGMGVWGTERMFQ